eukprot:TRINITY_DN6926_c0_g1_i1.p1 TRINITY_DN6926_c0_g1~~TRINITY_DN6926_c0_g1_i1.p1  ORF type:complete len:332 (-),score=53.45 TRINITY_DN6926_c0_g1_i1:143-1138(-)
MNIFDEAELKDMDDAQQVDWLWKIISSNQSVDSKQSATAAFVRAVSKSEIKEYAGRHEKLTTYLVNSIPNLGPMSTFNTDYLITNLRALGVICRNLDNYLKAEEKMTNKMINIMSQYEIQPDIHDACLSFLHSIIYQSDNEEHNKLKQLAISSMKTYPNNIDILKKVCYLLARITTEEDDCSEMRKEIPTLTSSLLLLKDNPTFIKNLATVFTNLCFDSSEAVEELIERNVHKILSQAIKENLTDIQMCSACFCALHTMYSSDVEIFEGNWIEECAEIAALAVQSYPNNEDIIETACNFLIDICNRDICGERYIGIVVLIFCQKYRQKNNP